MTTREEKFEKVLASTEAKLETTFRRLEKMLQAIEEAIKDPDDPEKYTLAVDAALVEVIYDDHSQRGRPKRYKARLSEIIQDYARKMHYEVDSYKSLAVDPYKLLVQVTKEMSAATEILAKLRGDFVKEKEQPESMEQRERLITQLTAKGYTREEAIGLLKEAEDVAKQWIS